ncbi:MAG: DUF692 domain-containing protein [Chromatiaceae bacterium]|nr:DUF692 domain-containing protein [Chromatiaceae bacterium]
MTGSTANRGRSLPPSAGIGLRSPHMQEVLGTRPALGWVEVHSENYFGRGIPLEYLLRARELYPVSLHGVGMSVGSTDPLDLDHLDALRSLMDAVEPVLVSEHLSWGSVGGQHLNDLLPLPYTEEALDHVVARLAEVQDRLGRSILVENVSSYLQFCDSSIPEWEFLAEVATRSGCGILLDVNNIYVSAVNHGFDPHQYLRAIPTWAVQEIHLAGFTRKPFEDGEILVDTHSRRVAPAVWRLYAEALARFGPRPTLIEWDSDLPPLSVLLEEAAKAQRLLEADYDVAA